MINSDTLLRAGKEYQEQGIPVVAIKQKKPLISWAQWQTRSQTHEEFENQPWTTADGFAIVCGTKTETGLFPAAIDFDVKNVTEEAKANARSILKQLLTTRIEQTPSGGQHWIYLCHNKPKTVSVHHDECALELLGEGKLCIMAPSTGYKPLNDNQPAVLSNLETSLYDAMYKAGFKPKTQTSKANPGSNTWFDKRELSEKSFLGKNPPCIDNLYKGAKEGERNEQSIRLASYFANFRRMRPDRIMEQMRKINRFNDPPLEEKELQDIIKSTLNGGYVYGCQDPILKKTCERKECPIAPADILRALSTEEIERAETILAKGNLLNQALAYGRRKLIGEDTTLQSNFVLLCSGQTKYPISGVNSGFSGSGKNESIRAIKPIVPNEWYFEFTTSTPEAMKYLPEDFSGTLIIYEAIGVRGDTGSLSLRAIGEGESIETIYPKRDEKTGKIEMGRAKTNAKNFITTSSDLDINPDLYRRVFKRTMNHSTGLTKRVMAKKLRDAAYPDSIKIALGLEKELPFKEEDFQNALRLLNWKLEVIVFTPSELLGLLTLAVKKEQEVALRTHLEKILHFTRVLTLINQRQRLRAKIGNNEFAISEPNDLLQAVEILRNSITETVSRIEKRQGEVLELFKSEDTKLNKHDVASKLKITTKTAAKALKTLAASGYLREEIQGRMYEYRLLQEKPNHLFFLGNEAKSSQFYQKSFKEWLNTIFSTRNIRDTPVSIYLPESQNWTNDLEAITSQFAAHLSSYVNCGEKDIQLNECSEKENHPISSLQLQEGSQFNPFLARTSPGRPICFQELANQAKELVRLSTDFGTETCILCGERKRPKWQITLFDDSWGMLCGQCGEKLAKEIHQ